MESRQKPRPVPGDLELAIVREWTRWLTAVERWLLPHLARRQARRPAWAQLHGLRSPVERQNGWQWAEVHGEATPYSIQPLLGRAPWHADAVRDDWRPQLLQSLGEPGAVLGLEETGLLKQGQQVGGARGNRAAPQAEQRLAQSVSWWPTRLGVATPGWIALSIYRKTGPTTGRGARPLGAPPRSFLPPNCSWRGRGSRALSMRGTRRVGDPRQRLWR